MTLAARDVAHLIHPLTEPREMTEHGPRIVVAGDGWHVTDDHGNSIIDGLAGLWCVAVGHGRPEIIDAVTRQPNLDVGGNGRREPFRLESKSGCG